jgi:uncharacterized membrane protein YfcA
MDLLTIDQLIKSLVGFGVGTLIGMTGVGGGVLLLPILIFGLGVPPMLAVGSRFSTLSPRSAPALSTCAKARCG